jgi:hypothetical protein
MAKGCRLALLVLAAVAFESPAGARILDELEPLAGRSAPAIADPAAASKPAVTAPPVPIDRLQMPGLPNLARVEKGIYRGGRPQMNHGALRSLLKLGIKTVIDLQGGDLTGDPVRDPVVLKTEPGEAQKAIRAEIGALQAAGINAVNIPLDSLDPVTAAEAASIERVLNMLAASTPQSAIYVHCHDGKDRTGLVIALYRMRYDGWSEGQASAEMTEMGHTGYLDSLFTGNMDLDRVVPRFPYLVVPPPK